uniref:Uncharacterized protein n=1 Tax=Anopheles atroparvus TaxID=41427 RepID=A0A182J5L8_ANOAO
MPPLEPVCVRSVPSTVAVVPEPLSGHEIAVAEPAAMVDYARRAVGDAAVDRQRSPPQQPLRNRQRYPLLLEATRPVFPSIGMVLQLDSPGFEPIGVKGRTPFHGGHGAMCLLLSHSHVNVCTVQFCCEYLKAVSGLAPKWVSRIPGVRGFSCGRLRTLWLHVSRWTLLPRSKWEIGERSVKFRGVRPVAVGSERQPPVAFGMQLSIYFRAQQQPQSSTQSNYSEHRPSSGKA